MNYWLTTDTHFNHKKLIEYGRPEDFEQKITNGLKLIKQGDILIHLGDVCIGMDYYMNKIITELPCKKWLIKGNHDNKSINWYLEHGWDFVGRTMTQKLFGKVILFSHEPKAWDGYYELNIHGHLHDCDHRRETPEVMAVLNGYQKLLALEYTNYLPVMLEKFIREE